MSSYLRILFKIIFYFLMSIISKCIPKNKELVVVGSWSGTKVDDNILGLHYTGILADFHHIYFLSDSPDLGNNLIGWKVVRRHSILAYWLCMRCGLAIYCNSKIGDINGFCLSHKSRVVNLWHGSPLKKVGNDKEQSLLRSSSFIKRIFNFLSAENESWIASSTHVAEALGSAYCVPPGNFSIRKYPRYNLLNKNSFKLKDSIIIAPTFREELELEVKFFHDVFEALSRICIEKSFDYVVYLHPYAKISKSNVKDISDGFDLKINFSLYSITDAIRESRMFISDYSSLIFDAIHLNIPVVCYIVEMQIDDFYINIDEFDQVLCTNKNQFYDSLTCAIDFDPNEVNKSEFTKQSMTLRKLYCCDVEMSMRDFDCGVVL